MDADEVVELLATLVDKSLVVADEESGRFRLLEMVRGFSAERLSEANEEVAVRLRHFAWTQAVASEAHLGIDGPQMQYWLDRLETEHDNVRAALSLEVDPDGRLQLAVETFRFWYVRGYLSEGIDWLDLALSHCPEANPRLRSKGLNSRGILEWRKGQYGRARIAFEESYQLCLEEGDQSYAAAALNNLGLVCDDESDYSGAHHYFDRALSIYRELGERPKIGMVLANLGAALISERRLDEAESALREFLAISEETQNPWNISTAWHNLAEVALRRNDPDAAIDLLRRALPPMVELGDEAHILQMLMMSSQAAVAKGEASRAVALMAYAEKYQSDGNLHTRQIDLDDHEMAKAAARSMLAPEDFGAAWQRGVTLAEAEAVELALDGKTCELDNHSAQ